MKFSLAWFLAVSLCASLRAASPPDLPSTTDTNSPVAAQKALGIPFADGRIVEVYHWRPGSTPDYILIQDVHRHPEVQHHIASILIHAYLAWGLHTVFVEGAFAPVDVSALQQLPPETRRVLLYQQLVEGRLTGPEVAAVLIGAMGTRGPLQLSGIEDPQIYKENVAAYRQLQALREGALEEVKGLEERQNSLPLPGSRLAVRQLGRLRLLLQGELTPTTYAAYRRDRWANPSSATLQPAIAAAEYYYSLVDDRTEIFLNRSREMPREAGQPRVFIIGGFHADGMARRLREAGKSYAIIAPCVTQSGYESLYEKRLAESISTLQIQEPVVLSH